MTTLCGQLGAFGSRLTGAGWGGATVSLVAEQQCDQFIKQLHQQFYSIEAGVSNEHVFACKPAKGASIYKPDK